MESVVFIKSLRLLDLQQLSIKFAERRFHSNILSQPFLANKELSFIFDKTLALYLWFIPLRVYF